MIYNLVGSTLVVGLLVVGLFLYYWMLVVALGLFFFVAVFPQARRERKIHTGIQAQNSLLDIESQWNVVPHGEEYLKTPVQVTDSPHNVIATEEVDNSLAL